MAAFTKSVWFLVFVAMVLSVLLSSTAEAGRPFLKSETAEETAGRAIERFFDGLALGAIKDSGPSPGVGHSFTNAATLGGIKDSGPSPGVGHSFVTGTHQ